jgi:hypothetical protein
MKVTQIVQGAILATGLSIGAAYAATVDFTVGSASAAADCGDCSLTVPFLGTFSNDIAADASGAVGTSFSLDEGETSAWFDFFSLTASGAALFEDYTVGAAIGFSEPGGAATFGGGGSFSTAFGLISGGSLTWADATQEVTLADGTAFTVEVEQGTLVTLGSSATVRARVTLDSVAVAPVPLPASALLLLAGIGGLGAMRLRRKQAAAA